MNSDDAFDEMVESIRREIEHRDKRDFSETVLRESQNPGNMGVIDQPDGVGEITGPCGDTMRFYLKFGDGTILEAKFVTDGCGPTVACGSMLTRMVAGKDLAGALSITHADLLEALDGLPEEHRHCAELAVAALRRAISHRRR